MVTDKALNGGIIGKRVVGKGGGTPESKERDNAYDKAGFLSFMEFGGFDLRQVGYCGGFGRYGHVALAARACRLVHVWLMCPCWVALMCPWVRCRLVFSVLFGGLSTLTESECSLFSPKKIQ